MNRYADANILNGSKKVVQDTYVSYNISGRIISIREDILNKFADYVNPNIEHELQYYCNMFKDEIYLSDEVLSLRINSMWLKEIEGYE